MTDAFVGRRGGRVRTGDVYLGFLRKPPYVVLVLGGSMDNDVRALCVCGDGSHDVLDIDIDHLASEYWHTLLGNVQRAGRRALAERPLRRDRRERRTTA